MRRNQLVMSPGHYLSLDGEMDVRDDRNAEFAYYYLAHNTVSEWLNPHSLGTMSAFGCIENLV